MQAAPGDETESGGETEHVSTSITSTSRDTAHGMSVGDAVRLVDGHDDGAEHESEDDGLPQDAAGPAVTLLLRESHLMPPEDLPHLADRAARLLGARGGRIHLISRDQRELLPLPLDGRAGTAPAADMLDAGARDEPLSLEGTLAGRAYRTTQALASADGQRLWLPLLDGTERLGVFELAASGNDVEALREPGIVLASLVAELVVSKGQYTDTFERVRRALPMGVAAEMLWRQLPPLTFATRRFVVTAQLEPWHEVGGDAFDYSIDGDVLRFAVFDGMGHGLGATLLGSVALASYRNSRRAGMGLLDTARFIDATLSAQFGDESFVTGVLAELDLRDGTVRTLTAAHPAPLLVRGGRPVGELESDAGVPLGLGDRSDTVVQASLQPGDRLVLFTDGVVEARSPEGEFFGIDRLLDLLGRAEANRQPAPETLRRVMLALLEHQKGTLQDDATVLMLEWSADAIDVVPEELR